MKRCRYCREEFSNTWSRVVHEVRAHGKKPPTWLADQFAARGMELVPSEV